MQKGRRPVAVGFFFSLGHATIVLALVLAVAAISMAAQTGGNAALITLIN